MQFNSISDLYSKLSLKEVKRALQQTETKAKDASDKLMSLVATRYPDLLQVADMVDDMVETQTECMEIIVQMQTSCSNIPDFGISETRASIRRRQSQRLDIKQRQLQASVKIQQNFRVFLAKKRVAAARLKKQELIDLQKRQNEAAGKIRRGWQEYALKKQAEQLRLKKEKTQHIKTLLEEWTKQDSWTFDDNAWLCQRSVASKEIEDDVIVHYPSCASPRLFMALHKMVTSSIDSDSIDLVHYFDTIVEKTTASLARYQILFDMRFAGVDVKHTKKIIEMLDPIDYTLMDGLVNDAVVSSLARSKCLLLLGGMSQKKTFLNHDETVLKSMRRKGRNRAPSIEETSNAEQDQLARAPPCPRFPVAALTQIPSQRRKKSGSTPASLIAQARNTKGNGGVSTNGTDEPKVGGWWW
eukprot:g15409.t1